MVFCLLLSSCTNRQPLSQKNNSDQILIKEQEKIVDTIIQQEAMLVDIPIPLYDERIIISSDLAEPHTLVFGYKSPLSRVQAREFFMTQMERFGWQHLVSFNSPDLFLQFSSPDRYCTIVIKNSLINLSHSDIFIYIKKSEQ